MIQRYLFENKTSVHILFLLVVCYFAFFFANSSFFVNIMEARNFVTAREMIEKGNWLVPTMNGELRLAKPPFPTWITAVFGNWFGIENVSMLRFPAAMVSSLMVILMYFFTISLNKNRIAALCNSLVLASSFYIVYMGRTGTWDIYCHSFMLGAILFFHKAWKTENKNWRLFTVAGVFLGLSFLSKGPVAFFAVLIPFLIAYSWVYGGKIILQKWQPLLLAIGIFIVISFWWPVFISLAHANEAAAIAKLESGSWMNRHVRPFYYYWNFPIQSGIWTLIIFSALIFPYAFKQFEAKKEYKFALIWTITAVVLLSLIPEKKDRYLLPVLIPSALLAGQLIQHLFQVFKNKTADKWDNLIFGVNIWLIAIVALVMPVGIFIFFYQDQQISLFAFILFALFSEGIFLLLLMAWKTKNILNFVFGIICLMAITEVFIIPNTSSLQNRNEEFKNIREARNIESIKDLNLYSIGKEEFRIELVWEVGREVKCWNTENLTEFPKEKSFVVFSSENPKELFSDLQLQNMEFETIDHYDYNRQPKSNKLYFQKYMTLITIKQ
ncbi:glycosyltransferase family 39 protein [Labilibaculum sp. K2S]|uniref:ArnT family glycosyltransferase n=1 Tax=Labilibaculum sp. K2S TaxID=3056386 RepID=UPI0025A4AF10|nr:glycosyltransferase family 39 protein [Labilibaculum sp. K2S]MDM8160425.1 glycosyltransferase family 39 protein [Labilibaculum sp. K2S]